MKHDQFSDVLVYVIAMWDGIWRKENGPCFWRIEHFIDASK